MAIFEKEKKESGEYVALLDETGTLVAFITPVKQVSHELLVAALREKGLNAEIRLSQGDRIDLKL